MPLSKKAIKEYKKIYKKVFKEGLDDKEAIYQANRLLNLYRAVYGRSSFNPNNKKNEIT